MSDSGYCWETIERLRAELARRNEQYDDRMGQLREANAHAARAQTEANRLTAELARRDQQITAVRALADRLLAAQTGWRGVLNAAGRNVPAASGDEILAALDGGTP